MREFGTGVKSALRCVITEIGMALRMARDGGMRRERPADRRYAVALCLKLDRSLADDRAGVSYFDAGSTGVDGKVGYTDLNSEGTGDATRETILEHACDGLTSVGTTVVSSGRNETCFDSPPMRRWKKLEKCASSTSLRHASTFAPEM